MALLLVTIGMLGIVFLQNLALRQSHAAHYQTVAAMQAAALMERFRANPSATGIVQEFAQAQQQIGNFLPQAQAQYQCSAVAHPCAISISWQDHGAHLFSLNSLL